MSDSNIVWQDPPSAPPVRAGRARRFIDDLRKQPGRWAIYDAAHPTPAASYLRKLGCEAVCRQGTVYARWPA